MVSAWFSGSFSALRRLTPGHGVRGQATVADPGKPLLETLTMNENNQPPLTKADLQQFSGDLERNRHSLNRHVIYTPGVKFLSERGGAYWLIDAIASYFGSSLMNKALSQDDRLQSLQFWCLTVGTDKSAVLTMRADSGVKAAITQHIPFTDFPLDSVDIWAASPAGRAFLTVFCEVAL